jgi:hypothetical protein
VAEDPRDSPRAEEVLAEPTVRCGGEIKTPHDRGVPGRLAVQVVGRGGVEPPTFRFSDVAIALLGVIRRGWTVAEVCRWASVVADVVVRVVVRVVVSRRGA